MESLSEIIDRLEMRRMADGRYFAVWCHYCLHVAINLPKGDNVIISEGRVKCVREIKSGSIADCINDLKTRT